MKQFQFFWYLATFSKLSIQFPSNAAFLLQYRPKCKKSIKLPKYSTNRPHPNINKMSKSSILLIKCSNLCILCWYFVTHLHTRIGFCVCLCKSVQPSWLVKMTHYLLLLFLLQCKYLLLEASDPKNYLFILAYDGVGSLQPPLSRSIHRLLIYALSIMASWPPLIYM